MFDMTKTGGDAAIIHFLLENADALANAAELLGGRAACSRTYRLLDDLRDTTGLTRRLHREIAALHRAILTIRDLPATVSCPAVQSVQRAAPAAKPVKRRADVVAPTPVEPAPAPVRRRARDGYPACPKC